MRQRKDESLEANMLEVVAQKSIRIPWIYDLSYIALNVQEQIQRVFTIQVLFFKISLTSISGSYFNLTTGIAFPQSELVIGGEFGFRG